MKLSAGFLVLALASSLGFASAAPLGTGFSYQGRLLDGGIPANGTYDLWFTLYDADTGGTQFGPILTNTGTLVSNGIFATTLDFGAVFDGNARWLEVGVRPNGAASAFTLLAPRQSLTPTPYAIYSAGAACRFLTPTRWRTA